MKKLFTLALITLLSACGGGSDSQPETQAKATPKAGLYDGSLITTDNITNSIVAMLDSNGKLIIYSDNGEVNSLSVSFDGDTFSGSGHGHKSGQSTDMLLSGTYISQSLEHSFDGSSYVDGSKTADFSLSRSYRSERDSGLNLITGNYTAVANGELSFSIDVDGLLTGSDVGGCQYSGTVFHPDPSLSLYSSTVTVSSCGNYNGVYEGLGTQVDVSGLDYPVLLFLLSNTSYALIIKTS